MDQEDPYLKVCQLKGNVSSRARRYTDMYFFKYTKSVHHEQMGNAEVSLAFQTNSQLKSIQKIDNPNIWVFFPTKDQTALPCLLHGSFETAVSREKLMRPSSFNDALLDAATELFAEAVLDFKKRNLITQSFIRQILITAFGDSTLPKLKKAITELFKTHALIPINGEKLVLPEEAQVAVPFDLFDLSGNELLKDSFDYTKEYVTLNDERSAGFIEYYAWLRDALGVKRYSIAEWANSLKDSFGRKEEKADYDQMQNLYAFLDEYRLPEYTKEAKTNRKKSIYEEDVQAFVRQAWVNLKKARILINAENDYIAAYKDDTEQVYLSSTSDYHKIAKNAIVLSFITDNYKTLLEDSFCVKEFDNFEYVKDKILVKYPHVSETVDVTESFVREYAEDILQISHLMMNSHYLPEMQELLSNRCVVLAKAEDGVTKLMRPKEVCKPTSVEGANLHVYFSGLGRQVAFLDEDFYKDRGISIDSISKIGILTTPVQNGPREANGVKALGDFRPYLEIKYLRNNIEYIQEHAGTELAKKKSACLLKIVLENAYKMSGKVIGGMDTNFTARDMICRTLDQLRKDDWLYVHNKLMYIDEISKNQLDKEIYKDIELSHYTEQCKILGFSVDETEKAFDGVDNLDKSAKQLLLKKLAKELGVDISVKRSSGEEAVFDPDDYDMEEFPAKYIVNKDLLNRHVENQFYSADPIRYKEVVIKQKVDDAVNRNIRRAYIRNMYTNQFGKLICQSCRHSIPKGSEYAVTIANFGIEMEQLNLCLCPNCYQKYETIKKTRRDDYKESIKRAIEHISLEYKQPSYLVEASREMKLYFTQTHLAELQNIFLMLDKYGVPTTRVESQGDLDKGYTGGKLDEIVVHDGEMIEYETMSDMKKHTVELDVDRYKLHKEMDGRPLNVLFEYNGEKYRITRKL